MLWQPALPETYTRGSPGDLAERIAARRRELGSRVVILGHHYQTDDVIRHADFTGDSLKLSQLAATEVKSRAAEFVIFCGVHFMAETADMLTPERVAVILPDLSAGCSMADMADYDDARTAWNSITKTLKQRGWKGRVVPVTYVNSTAAIKAFVGERGGCVCTSSNAPAVLQWALAGGETPRKKGEQIKVLFLPDQHLGRNTACKLGLSAADDTALYDPRRVASGTRSDRLGGMTEAQLEHASVLLWAGHCSVHKLFRPEHIHQLRAAEKDVPKARRTRVLVHPECCKEVVDLADENGSTEYIIRAIQSAPEGTSWAIGTEVHLVARLAKAAAARNVGVRILSDCQCLCTTMYRIDEPHLCWVLDELAAGKVPNRITVHPDAKRWALVALDRMMALSPPPVPAPAPTTANGSAARHAALLD